jgi:deoxyribonuclease-1
MHKKILKIALSLVTLLLAWTLTRQAQPPPALPRSLPTPTKGPPDKGQLSFATTHPANFDAAKQELRELFPSGREIYCDCAYDFHRKRVLDFSSCGFKAQSARGHRIEWEHVVPASVFGRHFTAWTQGHPSCQHGTRMQRGRECAREASIDFRRMEADLYNLWPAIGELNRARSNFPFGEVAGEDRKFGRCDFEVKGDVVEPPPHVRGDIARIYFYMDARYPQFGIVHRGNRSLLQNWHEHDPLDAIERQRLARIAKIQGNTFFIGRLETLRVSQEAF